jgi:hypothetical protein
MEDQVGKTFRVLCQHWEESERGWGTRPDGYSLHPTNALRESHIAAYWANMPDEVPDEYERPVGLPYWCEVSEETYQRIIASKQGIREFHGPYPKAVG